MPSHQSHDVRHRLVRFDSQRLQHKNASHTGTRYAIVLFNKDLNYAGSTEDARSNRIKAEPPVRLSVVPTFPADQAAFLEVLDATRFPQDRSTSGKPHSKYGETRGTFLSFGETQSRKSRADRHFQGLDTRRSDNQNNTKYATLYQAFLTYMEVFAPGEFGGTYTSCIIAKNSKCEWHCDTGNIGHASITALGPYEGGELLVESEKEVRTVEKWGYKNQVWTVPTLAVTVRPDTTDDKVIAEVLTGNAYQNRTARFTMDADDKWLDLGGNIGTFALLALAAGGTVVSVEPEPENAALMRTNLAANFETGWSVRECGVAPEPGTMDLQLCNGARNKYRHSMFVIKHWNTKHKVWKTPTKPRETVAVPVESLASMLDGINAVKMDIEGMEIELLESLTDAMCTGLQKLVFEYTWDVDPSVPRFLAIVKHLRKWFTVHYTGVNPDEPEYRHYPAATMVYCVRADLSAPAATQVAVRRPDDYIIAIPSYHRLKCFQTRTYTRVIQKHGLNHKVHLYLQNPEDVAEYGAAFPDLTIHESPPGLLATMNHIGHAWPIGKRVVVMHDDLTCVHGLDTDGKRANVDLDALFTSTFARLDALNLHLAGFYPHSNPLSMIKAPEETTDLRFIHDPLHLVRNQRVPLSLGPKQDFERTIEYYKRDGGVLRLNRFAFRTSYNPKTSGGYGHRTREEDAAATQLFLASYQEYVKRVITRKSGNSSVVFRRGPHSLKK